MQTGGISSPIVVSVPFIFGQPIVIALTLNVDASADAVSDGTESGVASAAASFFNTFKWDGITTAWFQNIYRTKQGRYLQPYDPKSWDSC